MSLNHLWSKSVKQLIHLPKRQVFKEAYWTEVRPNAKTGQVRTIKEKQSANQSASVMNWLDHKQKKWKYIISPLIHISFSADLTHSKGNHVWKLHAKKTHLVSNHNIKKMLKGEYPLMYDKYPASKCFSVHWLWDVHFAHSLVPLPFSVFPKAF